MDLDGLDSPQEKITKSQQRVQDTKKEVDRLWQCMCEYDGVPPTVATSFKFSNDNPFPIKFFIASMLHMAALGAERKNKARREENRRKRTMNRNSPGSAEW